MTMLKEPGRKYRPFPPIDLSDRQWPSRTITHPPRWLSTDLRDGNQAIVDPMDAVKKNRFFDLLVKIGVKEIEIGFPAAGQTEFDFIQGLVRSGKIPEDVTVQVLTQARQDLIKRSFESLEGARAAIVHVCAARTCAKVTAICPTWAATCADTSAGRAGSSSGSGESTPTMLFTDGPVRSSMTRNEANSSCPASWSSTTCGWLTRATASISRAKREAP